VKHGPGGKRPAPPIDPPTPERLLLDQGKREQLVALLAALPDPVCPLAELIAQLDESASVAWPEGDVFGHSSMELGISGESVASEVVGYLAF